MITPTQLAAAEYIVDASGVVDTIAAALRQSPRGRKSDLRKLRLALIGLYLSVHTKGSATLKSIDEVLTTDLSLEDQRRLGIRSGDEVIISYDDLRYLSKTIQNRLDYGKDVADADLAQRNRAVVTKVCDDLMDVFDLGFTSTAYAVDATALWAWELGRSDEDSGDAQWMGKTSKKGGKESFFGFHEHTLVQVPDGDQDRSVEPRLVVRLEVTGAKHDVVEVTLSLLDRLARPARDLIGDRLYQYQSWDRWGSELIKRRVRQHLDLRADQHGFTVFEQVKWAAGWPHCPATPDAFGTIPRPGTAATAEQSAEFRARIDERQAYAMPIRNHLDGDGRVRFRCPALTEKVGCPLRPGSTAIAIATGAPIVANPPGGTAEPLPLCCTQETMASRPPEQVKKLMQVRYWGSAKWERMWKRRTYVEGSYGCRKNGSQENMRRGFTRSSKLPWVNLVIAMAAASYNTRRLQAWYEKSDRGDLDDHPLLRAYPTPLGFEYVYPDEAT
jgi:hypothetical protein